MRGKLFVGALGTAWVMAGIYACSSFESGAPANPPDEAAATDGASTPDVPSPEADPPEPPAEDAGIVIPPIGDAGVDAPCPLSPTSALPFSPPPAPTAQVCNADGALAANGKAAGLDYVSAGGSVNMVGGHSVTSCIGVGFAQPLGDAVVRLASIGKACEATCTVGTGCGTYDYAVVFFAVSKDPKTWTYVGSPLLTTAFQDFFFLNPALSAATVVVCRSGGGTSRDDVMVDLVTGHCR